ncbi:MAG: ABC transporter substrate-binding protein [Eubacteriales bacterium]|nr:ABC transporter substrate-binding protein [Eubacteriales bacterium]
MKKLIAFILSVLVLAGAFSFTALADDSTIRIAGLKGPTSMGLVKLMEDSENGISANSYEFTLAGSADEVTPKLIKGELDIAAVPANLASVLYNNTDGAVKLLAVNTLGVLYILEKGDSVSSVADLKGKTIYATGKGSTPEYTLRYILQENGIDPDKDVVIEFKSEPTEVVALLSQAESGIAMLPQPYVTVAQGSVEGLHIVIDLTDAWNKLDNGSMLITGVIVGRSDFIDSHKDAVDSFLEEYRESADYAVNNTAETAQLIEKYGIVKAAVAEKALPFCNLTFMAGDEMIAPLSGYLQTLFDQNPKAVGGKLPGEDFFYLG